MEFSARIKLDCKIYIKTLSSIYGVGDVDILKVLNKRETAITHSLPQGTAIMKLQLNLTSNCLENSQTPR